MILMRSDVQAFEVFYCRHSAAAFVLARRILNDSGLAAEVTQDAFLGVWRNCRSYRPELASPRTWLLAIVRNRSIDRYRRERRRRCELLEEKAPDRAAPSLTEDRAMASVERQRLARPLARLPIFQRRVIELTYFGGLSHTEIAELLGVPLGTVKSRMRLALGRLRDTVANENADPR